MGLLHRVGGGQVVVLTGVDDHARIGVDGAGEGLVHQGALHVDVAEQDAVQGVVQHDVQALEGAHGGDLGHAQAGAVVAHADVAAQLLAHLVHGLTHQAEVLLGGVGAAEALGGGAVGHVVQQGLAGGADDGDDVGALAGGGGGLHHVLIDVAGGHDQVDPGALLLAAVGGNEVLAALAAGADLGQALLHDRSQGGVDVRLAVDGQLGQLQLVGGHVLGDGLGTPCRSPPWRCRSRRRRPGAARPCPSGGPPRRWAGGHRRRPHRQCPAGGRWCARQPRWCSRR